MPTNGLIIAYFLGAIPGFNPYSIDPDKTIAYFSIKCVFLATAVIPLLLALVLKKLNKISSLHMPLKKERMFPFFITGSLYYCVIYLFSRYWELPLPILIYQFMFGATLAIIIGMIITYSWKISIHMIGVGGIVGIIIALSKNGNEILLFPLIVALIISGFVGFGRLQLNAHSASQLIAGFILGCTCEILNIFTN
jgi:membrane-associated phospholipid phosphatase